MKFEEWMRENVHPDLLLKECERVGQTAHLVEKDENSTQKVLVKDIPESTVIVRCDISGMSKMFSPKAERRPSRNFGERCDFLILNETIEKYRAIFIELKSGRRNITKGKQQLRWSLPFLKYYLAVYETDCVEECDTKDMEVRYFIFSKEPRKRKSRDHLVSGRYENIFVNISASDEIEFRSLLDRGAMPALP